MAIGLTDAVWLCSPAMDVILSVTLLARKRWQTYPAFYVLVAVDLLSNVLLYWIYKDGTKALYTGAFGAFSVISFAAQIAVLFELARVVLKQTGTWTEGAIRRLCFFTLAGALLASVATLTLSSIATGGAHLISARIQLFTVLITCEVVLAISLAAGQLGLPLRSHALAIGQGLAGWALLAGASYGLESFVPRTSFFFQVLELIRILVYPLTALYWTVSLWYEEPARKPISPALQKYIVALHDHVHYDLRKIG